MKKTILLFTILFCFMMSFAQKIKKENLNQIASISDLTPNMWNFMQFHSGQRLELEKRMKYTLPHYVFPENGFSSIVDFSFVEVAVVSDGKLLKASSLNETLTSEQKQLISIADQDTEIQLNMWFNLKGKEQLATPFMTSLRVMVTPSHEAVYPGGNLKLVEDLTIKSLEQLNVKDAEQKITRAEVSFTIDEMGKVNNAAITRSSSDKAVDQRILEITNRLKGWQPAKDAKEQAVKQRFSISLGQDGC